jgi:hypothetical protein
MKLARIAGAILFICSTCLYAQEALVGKYIGSLTAPNQKQVNVQFGITIEITSAENGKLKGTISNQSSRPCKSDLPAEGTYEGSNVKIAVVEAGLPQGCGALKFEGVAEGNKLVGKMPFQGAPRDLVVSK